MSVSRQREKPKNEREKVRTSSKASRRVGVTVRFEKRRIDPSDSLPLFVRLRFFVSPSYSVKPLSYSYSVKRYSYSYSMGALPQPAPAGFAEPVSIQRVSSSIFREDSIGRIPVGSPPGDHGQTIFRPVGRDRESEASSDPVRVRVRVPFH